jgi:N-methylhydantoinase B/oxoprolinase/acetone carboxylase alpha subunit
VYDPIRLEVAKNPRLASTDEMSAGLQRAAYSTRIETRGDFSWALLDPNLQPATQSPVLVTEMGTTTSVPPALMATVDVFGNRHLVRDASGENP